jgi:hypothetical protein
MGTLTTLWSRVRDDARAWSFSERAAVVFLAIPLVATLLLAATYLVKPVFRFITDEDSVLEWIEFLALASLVVGTAWVAALLYRRRAHGLTILFGSMAIAAFVVAGEEISWGQRLLGIVTPSALEGINEQGETNIHNIGLVQGGFWTAELLVSLYCVIVPLVVAARRPVVPWQPAFALVPPLFLVTWFALPLGYRLARLTVVPHGRFAIVRMGELTELALYAGAAVFLLLLVARLRREPASVVRAASGPDSSAQER